MVWFCSCVGDEEFLGLLSKSVDLGFTLQDLLCAIGVEGEVVAHFVDREAGGTIGVLGHEDDSPVRFPGEMEGFCELLGQNEEEQNARVNEVARAEVMERKDYGINKGKSVVISSALVKGEYRESCRLMADCGLQVTPEDFATQARLQLLKKFAAELRVVYGEVWNMGA
ncbi:hypothetical protein KC318_g21 [Hortaea werneckii]|nr:hypothetical protein KC334_g20 [Hortaea werneckii]KAI7028414.1 hypothetical protein KC355_g22 [Hortaea werneckii]KAI7676799.1 hypothetical protein KC318_g21 [Hortaea werneckii]